MAATETQQGYWCIVPAAGIGRRMAADCPKQYLTLGGKTVIEQTLTRLLSHPAIVGVVVVLAEHDSHWASLGLSDPAIHTTIGGDERVDSVAAGLAWLRQHIEGEPWVLVHDAARPLLTHAELDHLIAAGGEAGGAVLGAPVRDTMKRTADNDQVAATVERDHLWHAFTPQMFRLGELREAIAQALAQDHSVTDEASAMEFAGYPVTMVAGSWNNIKITHPQDLALAELILQAQQQEQTEAGITT